jgi:hypothetical protein
LEEVRRGKLCKEQKHLDTTTAEHAYYNFGYASALNDILNDFHYLCVEETPSSSAEGRNRRILHNRKIFTLFPKFHKEL